VKNPYTAKPTPQQIAMTRKVQGDQTDQRDLQGRQAALPPREAPGVSITETRKPPMPPPATAGEVRPPRPALPDRETPATMKDAMRGNRLLNARRRRRYAEEQSSN
jgi:hypothetical protein